ncbi:hypothetical protein ACFB49_07200 [Sphingomonas sp. DBB INV C78]|uniref:hypothetical protein n=1 Tax=Sphingomonas sp. DBB INV C78 TaxID=3349434 RepID=UPI0036D2188F
MRFWRALLLPMLTLFCIAAKAAPEPMDALAESYVRLVLRVAAHEPAYLDAYFGPESWKADAERTAGTPQSLIADADRLTTSLKALPQGKGIEVQRRAFLLAQLGAVRTKLAQMAGAKPLPYADEALAFYGISPPAGTLADLDPALARIDALLPGEGPLADRVAAFRKLYEVKPDRLDAVARTAVAECRRRTQAAIGLPAGEDFRLEIVHDKPWAAYNWYQGKGHSLMQFNTRYPLALDRVLETACHEAYPGHHLHNSLLDAELVQKRGWVEFSIYPLSTPFFLIAEGIGNVAPELAFTEADRIAFERDTLNPLAGLGATADPTRYRQVARELQALKAAGPLVAADYLDGRIDRETAVERISRYALLDRQQAEASVDLMPKFRSYGLNYTLGEQLVRTYVEAAGPDRTARWAALRHLLTEPVTPAELLAVANH